MHALKLALNKSMPAFDDEQGSNKLWPKWHSYRELFTSLDEFKDSEFSQYFTWRIVSYFCFFFLKFCLKWSFIRIRNHSLELDITLIKLSQLVEFILWKNEWYPKWVKTIFKKIIINLYDDWWKHIITVYIFYIYTYIHICIYIYNI